MHEQLNALPLSELKELAKEKGLKGISSLRKADLIQLICQTEGTPGSSPSSEVNGQKAGSGDGPKGKPGTESYFLWANRTPETARAIIPPDRKPGTDRKLCLPG